MKVKYPKRTLEDDLRDFLMEVNELAKQTREMYNNYMISKFGETSTEHLPCDSCEEE